MFLTIKYNAYVNVLFRVESAANYEKFPIVFIL